MAKDQAIQNQKVFVSLGKVLQFQRMVTVAQQEEEKSLADAESSPQSRQYKISRRRAFEEVVKLFDLPIPTGTRQ